MSIQAINNEGPPVQLTRLEPLSQKSDSQPTMTGKPTAAEDSVAFSVYGKSQAKTGKIESFKADLNEAAGIFKDADGAMAAIEANLKAMKGELEGIVKNFPPFPQGSDDRVRMLKSFNALRQQIDALSYPPVKHNGTNGAAILADPAVVPNAGTAVVGDVKIAAQEVHTGETGLAIPPLPDTPPIDATDDQINEVLEKVGQAYELLQQRRSALKGNAKEIIHNFEQLPVVAQLNIGAALAKKMELSDDAALKMSGDVKHQLAASSFEGLMTAST